MKALSIKQPWASMIADGEKTIETRTWPTRYRGELALCASATPRGQGPTRAVLAVANLVSCRPMVEADEGRACCDIYPGAFSWVLANVRRLAEPVPIKGQLGVFELPSEVEAAVRAAVREGNVPHKEATRLELLAAGENP